MLLYYSFKRDIEKDTELWAKKLQDNKIQALLNGSGINNIPNLNIISTNNQVTIANNCQNGPVYLGKTGSKDECVRTCANSTADLINVHEDETYIYNSNKLQVGVYCTIAPRPLCNMKTTYALMTINSIVCRSKYPDLIGGELGTEIIACKNRFISDPKNVLWDYANNELFSVYRTEFTDTNERLSDNSYRFACKFNGLDANGNKYIANPLNRFHPMRNYCAGLVHDASDNIKTVFDNLNRTFECDCGNFDETRVKNIDPNNKRSQCSNLVVIDIPGIRSKRILTVPYKCFNLFSPLSDVGRYLPCPNDQFTRDGSQMATVTVEYSTSLSSVIEHPQYDDFRNDTVSVYFGKESS